MPGVTIDPSDRGALRADDGAATARAVATAIVAHPAGQRFTPGAFGAAWRLPAGVPELEQDVDHRVRCLARRRVHGTVDAHVARAEPRGHLALLLG